MKKTIALMMILCMVMAVFTACGGSGSDTDSGSSVSENPGNVYRAIVKDESGAAVKGVNVQLCSEEMCVMAETDAGGIAVFDGQQPGSYTIKVYSVPEGYAEDHTEYPVPDSYGDVSITLKAAQ